MSDTPLVVEQVPVEKLKPAPYNPRKISDEAMAKLEKSLETFGVVDPLIVNKRTGYRVIGGHQRLAVLKKRGIATAPCVILDIDEDREKMLNIALNNQNMAGEYDFTKMADLLLEFDAKNLDVSVIGFDEKQLAQMMVWTPGDKIDAEGALAGIQGEEMSGLYVGGQHDVPHDNTLVVVFEDTGQLRQLKTWIAADMKALGGTIADAIYAAFHKTH